MITKIQQDILQKMARVCEIASAVRFGQLLAHLDFLSRDMFDRGLGEIEDEELLSILHRHEGELTRRKSNVA